LQWKELAISKASERWESRGGEALLLFVAGSEFGSLGLVEERIVLSDSPLTAHQEEEAGYTRNLVGTS
jgi:hypothetical protein